MAWTQSNATTLADLISQLRTFLFANGWTSGGSDKVTNSDSFTFQLTPDTARTVTPWSSSAVPDYGLQVRFNRAGVGGSGYNNGIWSNDFSGPFSNMWFFTDGKVAHVCAQSDVNRYTHIHFGSLDHKGIHGAPIAFTSGLYHSWWRWQEGYWNNGTGDYPANQPNNGNHSYGVLGYQGFGNVNSDCLAGGCYVALPDNIADPALGFNDGVIAGYGPLPVARPYNFYAEGDDYPAQGLHLDFWSLLQNQNITGGVQLIPVGYNIYGNTQDVQLWIGEIPRFRLCKMDGLSPGQTISYAGEDWLVFPAKQLGYESAERFGSNPQPDTNTVQYGFAYRKG